MAKEVDVNTQIDIEVPLTAVAEYAFNPANAPEWYVNIQSVEWKTEPRVREGAKAAFKAQFMGKTLAYTYEVVKFIPEKELVMRTAEGPFPMQTTYRLEDKGEGITRMYLRNNGQPKGFSKLMAPLIKRMMRKANEKDLKMIKAIIEK